MLRVSKDGVNEEKLGKIVQRLRTLKKISEYEKIIVQYLAIVNGIIRDKTGLVQYFITLNKILQCLDMVCLLLSGQYKNDAVVDIKFLSSSASFFWKIGEMKKQEVAHIAYVNLDGFNSLNDASKKILFDLLKNKEEVYFVDVDKKYTDRYLEFYAQFTKLEIPVYQTVLQPDNKNVQAILNEHMQKQRDANVEECVFEYFNEGNLCGERLGPLRKQELSSKMNTQTVIPQNFRQ